MRKAAVHRTGGSRRNDRRLPHGGRLVALRRVAVFRAEIREGEAAGGRGRVWPSAPRETGREAFGPAFALVLGRRAVGRWRGHGPRLPRHRLLLVVSRQA